MPDTQENKEVFSTIQGTFPMARVVSIFSLSNGSVLDAEIGPCRGKSTGECSMLFKLWPHFKKGDVLVFDRAFSTYQTLSKAVADELDVVSRLNATIKLSHHEKTKIGKDEWLLKLKKSNRSGRYADPEGMENAPEEIELRLIKINFKKKSFRPKTIFLVTTLLDIKQYPKEEVAALYNLRWEAELDLRSLKSVMQLDMLRTKTPSMIYKEIWMHFTAYNLIRIVMAQAAEQAAIMPRELSFKASLQLFESFRFSLTNQTHDLIWNKTYAAMIRLIGTTLVPARPGRIEPRAVKRRPKPYMRLNTSREEARKGFWKRGAARQSRENSIP